MDENIEMKTTRAIQIEPNLSALPQIGEVIDEKYQIIREIARGGMGVVYEALDLMFNRKIALKMIQFQSNSYTSIKRFEREMKACCQLSHPNIIKIYNNGIYKRSPYMVMEYVQGISISEYIRKHDPAYGTSDKRDYNLCIKLILQVAHALEYVHSQKIYHRDIKPSNILVCEDGRVVLIDFGIVKFQDQQSWSITKENSVIGTCKYMPPEQINGSKIDAQTDVYSLGIVLYELLTEKSVFSGSIMYIMSQVLNTTPASPTSIRNDIPKTLEKIVMHAIEKDKNYRYKSAKQFANALEYYLDNKQKQLKDRSSRKKIYVIICCIILLLIECCVLLVKNKKPVSNNNQQVCIRDNKKAITKKLSETNNKHENSKESWMNTKKGNNLKEIEKYYETGLMYEKGEKIDLQKACFYFKKAAEQGHKEAQCKLAEIYSNGKGVNQDLDKAIYWYEKAANQGDPQAQCNLAVMYETKSIISQRMEYKEDEDEEEDNEEDNEEEDEEEDNEEDEEDEEDEEEEDEEENNEDDKEDEEIKDDENLKKAFEWFEKSANQGNVEAQYKLGFMYANGISVEKDLKKAFEWFEKSANQDNVEAQYELSFMYANGIGVEKDLKKTFFWIEKVAKQGLVIAQYNLSLMYKKGEGVEKDLKKAFFWIEKAAKQGLGIAQYKLSLMYKKGEGIEKDLEKADYWKKQAEQKKVYIQYEY